MTPLSRMIPGQKGTVIGFTVDSRISRRLLEMGVVPGRSVVYLRNAPLRDPLEVQVGSCCLSLRRAEASLITVRIEE
ncbi:MAG: ferrous iron transport protein A [Candidatus Zixiibacteriota bacterium]|nr:MAG: ferrous iron transport protein A [candidate division Zixibacteria bacterium]